MIHGSSLVMAGAAASEPSLASSSSSSQQPNSSSPTTSTTTTNQQQQQQEVGSSLAASAASSSLPNATTTTSTSTSTSSCCASSTTVASLLQSVAKMSLLDQHSYSPDDPDDDDNNNNDHGYAHKNVRQQQQHRLFDQDDEYDTTAAIHNNNNCSSLQSLQTQALPAMPDEQDRKRFLGCLAAVLASLYEYDQDEKDDDNKDSTMSSKSHNDPTQPQPQQRNSTSNNMVANDRDVDPLDLLYSSSSLHDMSNDSLDYESPLSSATSRSSHHHHHRTAGNAARRSSRSSSQPSSSTHHHHHPHQHYPHTWPSSAPSSTAARTTTTTTTNSQDAAHSRAQQRHRQRRYRVYAQFLASSAEWLQLDPSQGQCFVPLLSKLGRPQPKSQRPSTSTSSSSQPDHHHHQLLLPSPLQQQLDDTEHLRVFWEALRPGAGLRCVTLFLLQHLLHSTTGYDARIRHALQTVGVWVLLHDRLSQQQQQRDHDDDNSDDPMDWVTRATRQFEAIEHGIALKLIELSQVQQELERRPHDPKNGHYHHNYSSSSRNNNNQHTSSQSRQLAMGGTNGSSRDRFIRGLKIGGTAVAAGTLFAITGGLAAPGIAAGVATIVGTTAVATAAAALTSTVAVTTIFGVGGGGLVAYKMQRRTVGLTEFEFCKEESPYRKQRRRKAGGNDDDSPDAELFSTICMSGWLRDDHDFQRPWGIMPSRPPLSDRLELLERFYAIHKPGHILKCPKVLESWRGEEDQLWKVLRLNYGRDPDHLFPLDDGPRYRAGLTHEEQEVVDQIFVELGCTISESGGSGASERSMKQRTPFERMQLHQQQGFHPTDMFNTSLMDSLHGPHSDDRTETLNESGTLASSSSSLVPDNDEDKDEAKLAKIKHLATVWDYQTTYGGELYSVRWESKLLEELCYSVVDLASDVVTGATGHLLKYTALSALAAAMALPVALKSVANLIDGTWTLVVERTDEAGVELARSLLFSSAGNRPVSLVGFSFGARAIYSCLKELAIYQEKWEDYQERRNRASSGAKHRFRKSSSREEDTFFENMREPASIVGDVILMGLPNHLSLSSWKACRRVVAGRLVNCYSRKDLILSLMYQIKKFGLKPVCGTCAVNVPGVENLDVTDLVSGHQDYTLVAGEILKRARHGEPFRSASADFGSKDVGVVEEERRQMAQLRAMNAQLR